MKPLKFTAGHLMFKDERFELSFLYDTEDKHYGIAQVLHVHVYADDSMSMLPVPGLYFWSQDPDAELLEPWQEQLEHYITWFKHTLLTIETCSQHTKYKDFTHNEQMIMLYDSFIKAAFLRDEEAYAKAYYETAQKEYASEDD